MTTTPGPSVTTLLDKGLEYTLDNDGGEWPESATRCEKFGSPNSPYRWDSINMDLIEDKSLSGFRIKVRYYERYQSTLTTPLGVIAPDPLPEGYVAQEKTADINIQYPVFEIISQTLTKKSPDRQVFRSNLGDELETIPAGSYGPFGDAELCELFVDGTSGAYTPKTEFADNSSGYASSAGIKNNTAYTYGRVFNECDVQYIPRLSTLKQSPVQLLGAIPVDPHFPNADPPQYPMDSMYTLQPDPRTVVTMTYTLKTIYKVGNQTFTDEMDVVQDVNQNPELYLGEKMEALAKTTYNYNGFFHDGLYPWYYDPNYDSNGVLTGSITEPTTLDELNRIDYPYEEEGVPFQEPMTVGQTFSDDDGDVWTWNGSSWMYQDKKPGETIYKDVNNDRWEWNGSEWVKQ